jgi:rhodanese-related sulfurtransferase
VRHLVFALALTLLTSFVSHASAAEIVDISHKDLSDAVKAGKVVLLDCNNTLTYNKNHIPGAMDYGKIKNDLAKKLPEDKNTLIVAYCGNPSCTAYKAGYNAAVELGYTNVKHYSGGIQGWIAEKEKIESAPAAEPAKTETK